MAKKRRVYPASRTSPRSVKQFTTKNKTEVSFYYRKKKKRRWEDLSPWLKYSRHVRETAEKLLSKQQEKLTWEVCKALTEASKKDAWKEVKLDYIAMEAMSPGGAQKARALLDPYIKKIAVKGLKKVGFSPVKSPSPKRNSRPGVRRSGRLAQKGPGGMSPSGRSLPWLSELSKGELGYIQALKSRHDTQAEAAAMAREAARVKGEIARMKALKGKYNALKSRHDTLRHDNEVARVKGEIARMKEMTGKYNALVRDAQTERQRAWARGNDQMLGF